MRSVAETVVVFSVFPATSKLHLLINISTVSVNWSQLTSLSEDYLFHDDFVGLAILQEIISNMTSTASDISPSSLNLSQSAIDNFTALTDATSGEVSALTEYVRDVFLPKVVSLSASLRGNQMGLSSDQLLTEVATLNGELLSDVPATSRGQCECDLIKFNV